MKNCGWLRGQFCVQGTITLLWVTDQCYIDLSSYSEMIAHSAFDGQAIIEASFLKPYITS